MDLSYFCCSKNGVTRYLNANVASVLTYKRGSMGKSQEIQGLMLSEGGQTAAVCSVLTFKDLGKIVFHKLIKEAKLTM